ncbi:related to FPR3 - prolyl cis-trans isomerase [Cephalotrichum gorgonifer]|uniref:FK506-binding protein n=1 Tax=Cephalotrichum gorgonifer TaxID=2041049 RepID=A0AAE8MR32_9PEZI|nr:related to FPR3 - prolyl cis-trans isomerase [Cephalotrichum gorgonifer]
MSGPQALAIYGLTVPANEGPIPASTVSFPARFRITMAALDPTAPPEADEAGNLPSVPRSTLKLIRVPSSDSDEEESDEEDDDEYLKALINASDDDEEDSDEEANGGPSDPSKSKKQKRAEALAALIKAAEEEESDEEMADAKPNGAKKNASKKGKGKAVEEEEEESEEDSDDEDAVIPEEFVVCTLDTERTYQQPLDIMVREDEEVYFMVTGTHAVTLTGNYVESLYDDEDDEDEYDSEDDEDMDDDDLMLAGGYSDDESDELDDVADPRVTELDSDDDGAEAPALVPTKKGKNKRAAEEVEGLDALIDDAKEGEQKLSKKQAKKLKNNKGEAVASEEKKKDTKGDKKVQFAKELEQGPTGSGAKDKPAEVKSVRVVQGVTIDDRKVGSGRVVKNGDSVGMRYIGKLLNGKQFDANKKGKPFTFKVGKGECIKGWDVGILGMAIGGERRLTIPASMAYGSRGLPGIPANSTLVFDVKLLEIK